MDYPFSIPTMYKLNLMTYVYHACTTTVLYTYHTVYMYGTKSLGELVYPMNRVPISSVDIFA